MDFFNRHCRNLSFVFLMRLSWKYFVAGQLCDFSLSPNPLLESCKWVGRALPSAIQPEPTPKRAGVKSRAFQQLELWLTWLSLFS
jgi:hypothetical protein